jgi:hypothetical protein
LDGARLVADSKAQAVKQALRANTDTAIEKDVFGVPTMLIDDQLFWGIDQMEYMDLYLQGKDPIKGMKLDTLGQRGATAWRSGIRNLNNPDG